MKKVREALPDIMFWAIIAAMPTVIAFFTPYGLYRDSMYLFASAIQLTKGQQLYSQVNTLTTPLSLDLVTVLLKIFGASFRTYKILGVACVIAVAAAIDGVASAYEMKSPWRRLAVMSACVIMALDQFMLSYNELCILFSLLTVIAMRKQQPFIAGIFCGLAICAKQNLGAVLIFSTFLWYAGKNRKALPHFLGGAAIPICALILRIYPVWNSAYDLTIAGPKSSFGQNAAYSIPGLVIFTGSMISIALIETNLYMHRLPLVSEMCVYFATSVAMIYPIIDNNHIRMLTIGIILMLCNQASKNNYGDRNTAKILLVIPIIFFASKLNLLMQAYGKLEPAHYQYIDGEIVPVHDFHEVETYLSEQKAQGNRVFIISGDGVAYNIPADLYDPLWSSPFHGNIGADEINKWKSAIDSYPAGTKLLVNSQTELWQFPTEIAEYAEQSGRYAGQVGRFLIYEKGF